MHMQNSSYPARTAAGVHCGAFLQCRRYMQCKFLTFPDVYGVCVILQA
jgi:hypothetical protein